MPVLPWTLVLVWLSKNSTASSITFWSLPGESPRNFGTAKTLNRTASIRNTAVTPHMITDVCANDTPKSVTLSESILNSRTIPFEPPTRMLNTVPQKNHAAAMRRKKKSFFALFFFLSSGAALHFAARTKYPTSAPADSTPAEASMTISLTAIFTIPPNHPAQVTFCRKLPQKRRRPPYRRHNRSRRTEDCPGRTV